MSLTPIRGNALTIARLIEQGLKKKGWTHQRLCDELELLGVACTRPAVGHWLRDQEPPTLPRKSALNAMADIFAWNPQQRSQALRGYGLQHLDPTTVPSETVSAPAH